MKTLRERDHSHIWHPFASFSDEGKLPVISALDAELHIEGGKSLIDAISSWWAVTHGHSNRHIAARMQEQLSKLHHVIFADFTHTPAVDLAETLLKHLDPQQKKVFFSDNGSTAVEVALKISIQYWRNIGNPKHRIVALEDGYHGDTFGAMSVGARGVFVQHFSKYLFDVTFIPAPQKDSGAEETFEEILRTGEVGAFIYEPLVQGAAGMRIQDAETLNRLISLAKRYDAITIADEIMTGFGRTGKLFASHHLPERPDIYCLSKGLTGGTCPLAVTTCTDRIFDAFKQPGIDKAFLHGHTFTGNPLACVASLASLELFEQPHTWERIERIAEMQKEFISVLQKTMNILNSRSLGTIAAMEVDAGFGSNYGSSLKPQLMKFAFSEGVFLRPIGNTIYIMPPYCITDKQLERVYNTILSFLERT